MSTKEEQVGPSQPVETGQIPAAKAEDMSSDAANKSQAGAKGNGADTTQSPEQKADKGFSDCTREFFRRVTSLREIMPLLPTALAFVENHASQDLLERAKELGTVEEQGGQTNISFPTVHAHLFSPLLRTSQRIRVVKRIVPHTFLVALFSQFDVFLGQLLRHFFLWKPEWLNSSQKTFTVADLVKFSSLDAAKEFVLEKEIEDILRQNHRVQFDWLENKLKIPLRKELAIWPEFVEMSERRNLFVHTDGQVSSQYMDVCAEAGCKLEQDAKVGSRLPCTQEYFMRACEVVLEIGVKLGTVVRKKLCPDCREKAHDTVNNLAVDLMREGMNELALELLEFLFRTPKPPEGETQLYVKVNMAQCAKWLGRKQAFEELLLQVVWASLAEKYQLAHAVLRDQFDVAEGLMKKIGPDGDIGADDYTQWPLFKEFRKSDEFKRAYKCVFGHEYKTEYVRNPSSKVREKQ